MNLKYENQKILAGYKYIIGCDEVGRGCLAGPVVAAAVVLPQVESCQVYKVIKDSKLLSAQKREELEPLIKKYALAWSIAEVSSNEIDEINIHNASLLAMKKAVEGLMFSFFGVILSRSASEGEESQTKREILHSAQDDAERLMVVVDGKFKVPGLSVGQEAIIDGDNKILSIAAASIIAKVYRDNLMQKLHQQYPIYNLKQHKGYATEYHRKMIKQNGLSEIHRVSFCQNYR